MTNNTSTTEYINTRHSLYSPRDLTIAKVSPIAFFPPLFDFFPSTSCIRANVYVLNVFSGNRVNLALFFHVLAVATF